MKPISEGLGIARFVHDWQINLHIDRHLLVDACNRAEIPIVDRDGKIGVVEGHVTGLLNVMERRLYTVQLTAERVEHYRADKRTRLR